MSRLVTSKFISLTLIQTPQSLRSLSHPRFVGPVCSLAYYAFECVRNDYLMRDQLLVLRLLEVFHWIVVSLQV